jgi:hypothetical protein
VPDAPTRRQQLVEVALEERTYFSRAIVNRVWAYFFGRGLVQPLDQMHAANPSAVPGLLEWLGDDLATHGYRLDRLVAGIVSSRAYQLASTRGDGESSHDPYFARAMLRPLTPHQLALSLAVATGEEGTLTAERYRRLESQAASLARAGRLDTRSDRYQSSTTEALFLSNHPDVQRHVQPAGNNLAARLARCANTGELVETAAWAVLNRPPTVEERGYLAKWLDGHRDRGRACGQLVWALLTSAEFRFNH